MNFEYLDHTSEAKFRAYGKSKEEAFSNAALALFNLLLDTEKVKDVKEHTVQVKANDDKELMFDFLDKLIFLQDVEGFMLHKVKTLTIKENKLEAVLSGDHYNNYETHGEVKAPTYNDMEIEEKNGKWVIQVVVDV
jgi:SHS2 domain-containing protein